MKAKLLIVFCVLLVLVAPSVSAQLYPAAHDKVFSALHEAVQIQVEGAVSTKYGEPVEPIGGTIKAASSIRELEKCLAEGKFHATLELCPAEGQWAVSAEDVILFTAVDKNGFPTIIHLIGSRTLRISKLKISAASDESFYPKLVDLLLHTEGIHRR